MPAKSLSTKKPSRMQLGVIVILLIVISGILTWHFLLRDKDPTNSYHPKYTISSSAGQNEGTGGSDQATGDKNPTEDSTNTNVTSEQVPVSSSGSVTIVDLEQKDGYINAKASVSGFTTTKCVYSFTADEADPVVKTTAGSCDGISIPEVEFQYLGTYTLTVTAYNNTTEKITTMKDIDVR